MGLDCAWNSDIASESGREANRKYMEQCNEITTELFNKYKSKYPDTYYGFYFVTELFNTIYMDTDTGIDAYADGLDEMFTTVIDNCNTLDSSMPLLFSPYVNIFGYGYASINIDRFTEYWAEVLSRIPFRNGDMICPQDSCGGGGMDKAHLSEWTKAYRNAVDRSNQIRGTKLLLGTNAEMFVQPDAERMQSPHGISYTGIKDVRDFTTRLETASEYTDSLFCFAYPHHYSPYNTLPEFHQCLTEYLKTGEISRFAFAHCISLESINMPESLYSIEQYAFYDCPKLKGLNLPETLNIIEQRAFCGCKLITEISIPKSCKSIGEYAFLDCNSLNKIKIAGNDTETDTRSLGFIYNNGYSVKNGFIIESENKNAVEYAKNNGITIVSSITSGDVNADGNFDIADVTCLQKWLIYASETAPANWQSGDVCKDGFIDTFDLCLMKHMLLSN